MNTTLVIKNDGFITPEDLHLIGSSTKRDDNTKIGMFGSGWKYALAWIYRNNLDIQIYSGERPVTITKNKVQHRNRTVEVLVVDGKETSITTEMGIKWTGWMALRELVCNAKDEGGFQMDSYIGDIKVEDVIEYDKTTIILEVNREIKEVILNYEYYFAFERIPLVVNDHGAIFKKDSPDLINIYRKGIRCCNQYSDNKSKFDFSFDDIEINESRLADGYDIRSHIHKLIYDMDVDNFMEFFQEKSHSLGHNSRLDQKIIDASNNGYIIIPEFYLFRLPTDIANSEKTITVSNSQYRRIFTNPEFVDYLNLKGKLTGEIFYKIVDKDTTQVQKIIDCFNIPLEVKYGELEGYEDCFTPQNSDLVILNVKYSNGNHIQDALKVLNGLEYYKFERMVNQKLNS